MKMRKKGIYPEVSLEVNHFLLDQRRFQHWNSSLLEWMSSATIEVATARANAVKRLARMLL